MADRFVQPWNLVRVEEFRDRLWRDAENCSDWVEHLLVDMEFDRVENALPPGELEVHPDERAVQRVSPSEVYEELERYEMDFRTMFGTRRPPFSRLFGPWRRAYILMCEIRRHERGWMVYSLHWVPEVVPPPAPATPER